MKTTTKWPKKAEGSDLDVEQFARVKPLLESARRKTRPSGVDLREVCNAVLYVLKEGCRWRSLPRHYPAWATVYYYYRLWRDHVDPASGQPLLELILKKTGLRRPVGRRAGRATLPAHP